MLTLVTVLILGQITFVEHPLSDVVIGNVTPFTGNVTSNFIHADVNHDTHEDIIFPTGLYLQEGGVYASGPATPLPLITQDSDVDSYGGQLYYRAADQLSVYAFEEGTWKVILEQNLPLPDGVSSFGRVGQENPTIQFRRFLHDLNDDAVPELFAIDHRGAHLFRLDGGRYVSAGTLGLPARVSINRLDSQPIWPDEARKLMFPEQQMSCRLIFDGQQFRTVSVRERKKDMTQYAIQSRMLVLSDAGTYHARETHNDLPEPLPAHLRPCRLNADAPLDFAGGRWLRSETSPVSTPLYELWATLDGGVTFHVRRAAAYAQFRPHCSFVDFDGDGDMDMLTESTQWPRGSTREQVTRFLTEDRIEHVIKIYAQEGKAFSAKPDLVHRITFELEAPLAKAGAMLSRYEAGTLISLTGEFNGDGYRDLLVRTAPERLELYLASGWQGFESKPAWSREISVDAEASVADINGDGLSDIYVRSRAASGDGKGHPGTAYYTQRGRP